jgi:hypothetical protein
VQGGPRICVQHPARLTDGMRVNKSPTRVFSDQRDRNTTGRTDPEGSPFMRMKVMHTPMGKRLVQPGLEHCLAPTGYCTACGRGFFNQPPEGPPLTYCGCLGAGVAPRRVPRRFCPGCGNARRCRCPRRRVPPPPGRRGVHGKRKIAGS